MLKASYKDKSGIIGLLTESFIQNKSVNYVIKQDKKRKDRIRYLMDYSFEVCWNWGEVYISEDKKSAALISIPGNKANNLKAILLDLRLAIRSVGLTRVTKVLSRESIIKKHHPKAPFFYLWFVGVKPEYQNQGIGSSLIEDIIKESEKRNFPIYLETSTKENLSLYERFKFYTYNRIDFGYTLYCMKREPFVT